MTPDLPALALSLLQGLMLLMLTPALAGILRLVRARSGRRRGAGLLQPYRDLRRLWSKESIRAEGSGGLYAEAPLLSLCCLLPAAFMLPWAAHTTLPGADLLIFCGLLAASRLCLLLGALNSAAPFAAMGSGRELLMTLAVEPVLFTGLYAVMQVAGTSSPAQAANALAASGINISLALAAVALSLAFLAEAGRLPFENPATHLELTMIREALMLDYSGRDLALLEAGRMLRIALLLALSASLFLPFGAALPGNWTGLLPGLGGGIVKLAGLALLLAAAESLTARLRLFQSPRLLALGLLAAFLAVLLHLLAPVSGAAP